MPTTKTRPALPERVRRCRMLDRHNERCPNPSLDDDANSIDVCIRHAVQVVELINEHVDALTTAA